MTLCFNMDQHLFLFFMCPQYAERRHEISNPLTLVILFLEGYLREFSFLFPFLQIQVMDLLTNTAHVLQQMSILLKCCPNEKTPLHNWTPLPQAMLSSVAVSSAEDPDIKEMIQTLEVLSDELNKIPFLYFIFLTTKQLSKVNSFTPLILQFL